MGCGHTRIRLLQVVYASESVPNDGSRYVHAYYLESLGSGEARHRRRYYDVAEGRSCK